MKKIVSLMLVLSFTLIAISAFASTGLGSVTTISGNDADGEKNGSATINTTIATVTLDDEGKMIAVKFDVAQNKISYDVQGKWLENTEDKAANYPTKVEKGADYGMVVASSIGKEMFEQLAALEKYCIGKTLEEVLATETYEKDANHPQVPATDDLKSSVTIDVGTYFLALEKAVANAQ